MTLRSRIALGAAVTTIAALALAAPAFAASPDVVIAQVYGGGGNSGATLTNDYIELYNRGTTAVDLTGWSVQYASAAGTSWQVTAAVRQHRAGRRLPGRQESAGTGGTDALPTPDATGVDRDERGQRQGRSGHRPHRADLRRDVLERRRRARLRRLRRRERLRDRGRTRPVQHHGRSARGGRRDRHRQQRRRLHRRCADTARTRPATDQGGGGGNPPPTSALDPRHPGRGAPLAAGRAEGHRGAGRRHRGQHATVSGSRTRSPTPTPRPARACSSSPARRRPSHVGDSVLVSGTVSEFRPGGGAINLSNTEIGSPTVTVVSSGDDAARAGRARARARSRAATCPDRRSR